MHSFAHNEDKSSLEIVPVQTIFVKDPHMLLKKEKLGSVTDLWEGRKERALAPDIAIKEGEGGGYPSPRLKEKEGVNS